MNVVLYYGLVSGGGCERRMGDICRWLVDNGDEAWIVAASADNLGLTTLHGQCKVPVDRVHYMEPGDVIEEFVCRKAHELEADVIDHQWWGEGTPHKGFPVPAVCTMHGRVPSPPSGYYQGLLSVETQAGHRFLRALAPYYAEVWNWVDLTRFPFHEDLGEGACFLGRSFKLVNALKVAAHWPGIIDCYGIATTPLDHLLSNMQWKGFADPAEFLPRYRVVFASAMCALEAMATGRLVIAGQDFQETIPAGVLVTTANVERLAAWQFYTEGHDGPGKTSEEVYYQFCYAMEHDLLNERRALRKWVEDHHGRDGQIGKIRRFYEEVIG